MVALVTAPLLKRQSSPQPPDPSGNGQQTARDNSLPDYIWVAVSVFVIMAIACGICARRNHRRQFLYRQAILNSQRPNQVNPNQRQGLMDAAIAAAGIRRPARTRRRPSQASVTSLPVYMESAGANEVVLVQRTAPKEDDIPRPPSLAYAPQMPVPNTVGGGVGITGATMQTTNTLPSTTAPSSPTSPTSPTRYAPPPGPPPLPSSSLPHSNPFTSGFSPPTSPSPPPLSPTERRLSPSGELEVPKSTVAAALEHSTVVPSTTASSSPSRPDIHAP